MSTRVANRVASLLLALALLGGGLLITGQVVLVALARPPLPPLDPDGWYDVLRATPLEDPAVGHVAIGITVLGLSILVAQLRRWTPRRLALPVADGWYLHRRSAERRLADAVGRVETVTAARARIRPRARTWHVRIRAVGDPSRQPSIETAVREELNRLAAPDPTRVDLRLRKGRSGR